MQVYNTLSRRKEKFVPRDEGKVSIYACGPTVYNHIHIGNARTFLNFDVIRRYLEYAGFDVTFVQNITDVDDKIIKQAREEKGSDDITPDDVAKMAAKYTAAFEKAMSDLRVEKPTVAPKATEHIDGMIEMISELIERDYAYGVDGDVYFEVRKFADYGKLAGRSLDDMRAGERVEVDERKRDPMDFALWKSAKAGEPSWDSPWGKGRPGWHIECSVMSSKYLGYSFDIHGGATDLVFPHHENEIAQAEAATGKKPFVRVWMHAGLLNINKQKMAKSLGNFTLLKDVLAQGYNADEIRMLMLGTHYRKPLDFSDAALDEARAKIERIEKCLSDVRSATSDISVANQVGEDEVPLDEAITECERDFESAMDDDFNSAGALGAIFELVAKVNVLLKERAWTLSPAEARSAQRAARAILGLTDVFGLFIERLQTTKADTSRRVESYDRGSRRARDRETVKLDAPHEDVTAVRLPGGEEFAAGAKEMRILRELADALGGEEVADADVVLFLLDKRAEARTAKDWATSDTIRDAFHRAGLAVEDTPKGQRIKLVALFDAEQ